MFFFALFRTPVHEVIRHSYVITHTCSQVYQHCMTNFRHLYDWIFAGDSDEYIVAEDPNQCFGEFLEARYPDHLVGTYALLLKDDVYL